VAELIEAELAENAQPAPPDTGRALDSASVVPAASLDSGPADVAAGES
jgi:hypothetical protein